MLNGSHVCVIYSMLLPFTINVFFVLTHYSVAKWQILIRRLENKNKSVKLRISNESMKLGGHVMCMGSG